MSQPPGSTAEIIAERERDYILGKTKVKMKSSLENIEVGDYSISSLQEGQVVEVPRWMGEELVFLKLAEFQEEPFEAEVYKALSREKMMGPLQLSPLSIEFYMRMRRKLSVLEDEVARGTAKKEDLDRLRSSCYDLVGMRLGKMLSLSSSSAPAGTLSDKLTPEESAFFSLSQSMSKEWKDALLGAGK